MTITAVDATAQAAASAAAIAEVVVAAGASAAAGCSSGCQEEYCCGKTHGEAATTTITNLPFTTTFTAPPTPVKCE